MILLIDNYDSFTWNLVHYLAEAGAEVVVRRNDALTVEEALAMAPEGIVISPGPCDPAQAGIIVPLIKAAAARAIPLFGVCLGHQAIGEAFGGRVVRAARIVHGKVDAISHDGSGLFAGLPSPLRATRYHSLTLEPETLPEALDALPGRALCLVLGAEGPGLRERTRETCDRIVRIPFAAEFGSLNVSNAAAVALYAVSRA